MKPTSDVVLGAIKFALNDRPTSMEIKKRDESSLYLQSVIATVVANPSNPRQYEIKITFDYSPPIPDREDLVIWVGFDRDDNYVFIGGERR